MGFLHLKVRTRIYFGFGVLVALSVGIAGFGVYQFSRVGASTETLGILAGNTQRVLGATYRLEAVRRAETRYEEKPTEDGLKDVRDNAGQAATLLADAVRASQSEERRKAYAGVLQSVQAHLADLDQLARFSTNWVAEDAGVPATGKALAAAVGRVTEQAAAAHDQALADAAASVETAMLWVRVAAWQFVATLDKAGPAAVKANIARVRAALDGLQKVANPETAALLGPVRAILNDYDTHFAAFEEARLAANALFDGKMRSDILAMQEQLAAAAKSQAQDFNANRASVQATVGNSTLLQGILAAVALVLGAVLAVVIGRGIVLPLMRMTAVMKKLAAGDHAIEVPAREDRDEIGDMARTVEVFKENAIEAQRLAEEKETARAHNVQRQAAMEQHTQDFGASISGVMATLARSAEDMRRAAEAMAEATSTVRTEASGTAQGAAKSSQDLTAVAAAVEELNSSVGEISRRLAEAAEVARQAVQRADSSHATMQGLSEATARIGDVVRLISDIAGQTNLLALNATIEAARAGEAGKGFAVVAGEVKALAAQTAKATAEIGSQIETVRAATGNAVTAMADIGGIIGKMNEVSAAIATAVEQQSATTQEIAASVQGVSNATAGTAEAMEHVVTVAEQAGTVSQKVLTGSAEIAGEAESLRTEVDHFLAAVREDTQGERRRYERIKVEGMMVTLETKGHPATPLPLRNISRGGAMVACDWALPAGTALEVTLPQAGGTVPARVARSTATELAVVFSSEPQALAEIDRVLATLAQTRRAA